MTAQKWLKVILFKLSVWILAFGGFRNSDTPYFPFSIVSADRPKLQQCKR